MLDLRLPLAFYAKPRPGLAGAGLDTKFLSKNS